MRSSFQGEKAYSCQQCGTRFTYRNGLIKHTKLNRCPKKIVTAEGETIIKKRSRAATAPSGSGGGGGGTGGSPSSSANHGKAHTDFLNDTMAATAAATAATDTLAAAETAQPPPPVIPHAHGLIPLCPSPSLHPANRMALSTLPNQTIVDKKLLQVSRCADSDVSCISFKIKVIVFPWLFQRRQ